jgi:uncharacterized GH25 family protein
MYFEPNKRLIKATRQLLLFLTAFLCLGITPAHAHEFWLEPSAYQADIDELITLKLFVGEPFAGESFGRHQDHIQRFQISGQDVLGLEGQEETTGYLRPKEAGQYWVEYLSNSNIQRHSTDEFIAYLTEEGLLPLIDGSLIPSTEGQSVEEIYFRCAKAFIDVGTAPPDGRFQEPLGHPLEIVPQFNLSDYVPGQAATFLIANNGQPVPHVPVLFTSKSNPREIIRLQSDQHGMVAFDQLHAGVWLVAAIHTAPRSTTDSNASLPLSWQTYWSSLTFQYAPTKR